MLTGPTGSGKTTLLTQMSLDFAMQGVPTLWGSFELKNEVILSNMIYQLAGEKVDESESTFNHWANELEKIPLYFQSFFGSTELDKVLALIDYSIYAFDVAHIILDNLQFMLSGQGRGFERFELQDDLIAKLRKLATERNVHITLVIHPKKTEENQDLHVSSIFGTSKSTQEADNIIIIQNRNKYKIIDIKKNRFDGEIGKAAVIFDKELKKFYQISNADTESIYNGKEPYEIVKMKRMKQQHFDAAPLQESKLAQSVYEMFTEPLFSNSNGFTKYKNGGAPAWEANKHRNTEELIVDKSVVSRRPEEIRADHVASINSMKSTYFNESIRANDETSTITPISNDTREQDLYSELLLTEEVESDDSKNNAHIKWTIDNTNEPNFFKQGDVIYTYEDIVNELVSKNNGNKGYKNGYNKGGRQNRRDIEDELLDNLDK